MKINKIFHTLYFMVMFLPLFIIPIFAININQKSVEPISITTSGYTWQPMYLTNNPNNEDLEDEYAYTIDISGSASYDGFLYFLDGRDFYISYYYFVDINYDIVYEGFDNNYNGLMISNYDDSLMISADTEQPSFYVLTEYITLVGQWSGLDHDFSQLNIDIMEAQHIPQEYVYTEGVVYDNTDIGSQFLYTLYKPVNDYFNFKQYFGMNEIYDWFQLNFFNGTAPLSFFIFFNLMIYWLIISMLWLLFDIMMYLPMLVHRWLDKASIS